MIESVFNARSAEPPLRESIGAILRLVRERKFDESKERALALLAVCAPDDRPIVEACVAAVTWRAHANGNIRLADGLSEAIAGIARLRQAGYGEQVGWISGTVGYALGLLGDFETAHEWLAIAIDDALQRTDRVQLVLMYSQQATLLAFADEHDRALMLLHKALDACDGKAAELCGGVLTSLAYCQILRAERFDSSDPRRVELARQALAYADAARATGESPGYLRWHATAIANRGLALRLLGRLAEAEAAFTEGLALSTEAGQTRSDLMVGYAEVLIATGRHALARGFLEQAASTVTENRIDSRQDRILKMQIEIARIEGRLDEVNTLWERRFGQVADRYRDRLRNVRRYTELHTQLEETRAAELRARTQADVLRRTEAELVATRNRLWATLDALPDLMFELGADGVFHHYHSVSDDLLALPPAAFLGRRYSDVLPSDIAETVAAAMREAAATGRSVGRQYAMVLPTGPRWFELSVATKTGGGDRDQRFVVLARDITERKHTEQELDLARANAERSAEAKSQFLAHMSHEIRTPMNAVINIAALLREESLTPAQSELVGTIDDAGQSLLRIIDDILDFAKIEAGQLAIEQRPFELAVLLNRVESLLRGSAEAKGLCFVIVLPSGRSRPLTGDALRLEQVLVNLINNAIKFTHQGDVTLTVAERDETADGVRLRFEVRDSGIGIAPDVIATLFQPFTQADSGITRRFGGTGLGLTICKRVVEMMGGTIGIDSVPGEGSTFWFELPFTWAEIRTIEGAKESKRTGPQLAGLRVLAADDNKVNLLIVDKILKSQGATTVFAADGQQALQILQANPQGFDIVLMDVQMPVMDGLTATRAIRADPALAHLPVIALTAGVLKKERDNAVAVGVNDFLPKPLDPKQMIAMIAALCFGRPHGD